MIPGNTSKISPEKFARGKRLIHYAQKENWPNDKIDEEIALMQADCLQLKKCIKLPEPPIAYISYHDQTDKLKKSFKKEFNENPEIRKYLSLLGRIKTTNAAKLHWLKIYIKTYERKEMKDAAYECNKLIFEHHEISGIPTTMENIQANMF